MRERRVGDSRRVLQRRWRSVQCKFPLSTIDNGPHRTKTLFSSRSIEWGFEHTKRASFSVETYMDRLEHGIEMSSIHIALRLNSSALSDSRISVV